VKRYIRRQRLLEAFAMLSNTSNTKTIEEIALELCFADASSFGRAFRREFGITPTAARAFCSTPSRREPRPGSFRYPEPIGVAA
jgi:AraC-like DNA-binding protein